MGESDGDSGEAVRRGEEAAVGGEEKGWLLQPCLPGATTGRKTKRAEQQYICIH